MENHQKTLADLAVGESAVLGSIDAPMNLARRLWELGLLEGTDVRMVRVAPLGDPLEIEVRGYRLSLRRNEAQAISLKT